MTLSHRDRPGNPPGGGQHDRCASGEEAFEFSGVCKNLHAVRDGVEAMAFLRKEGRPPTPSARISSCSTSTSRGRTGGWSSWRSSRRESQAIPVILLSTSEDAADLKQAPRAPRQLRHRQAV